MAEAGIDTACKEALWTSALALIRISDRYIDYAQVGDCMIMAQYEDGSIRVVSRDQVAHMDEISKHAREEGIRRGLTTRDQLWEFVKPKLLQNRTKMNTIEGYSVMSGEPEVADLIEYGRINRIRLKSLLLVTDGLFLPADQAADSSNSIGGRHADAFAELLSRVADTSLEAYAHELIDLELEDKECQRYPRFKVSDDKTGIWIQFD
jgi:serine/threonine protein phosphatase PrpC